MRTMRMRRATGALLTSVLVMAALVATPFTALAGQLGELLSEGLAAFAGEIVYDGVYGVTGGEYAFMYKRVSWTDSDGKTKTGQVQDLVRADGTVIAHGFSSSAGPASVPGGNTDYKLVRATSSIIAHEHMGRDVASGLVLVRSRTTDKYGALDLSGKTIVPMKYDMIEFSDDGSAIAGLVREGTTLTVDVYSQSGASLGEVTKTVPQATGTAYNSLTFYGTNISVRSSAQTAEGYDNASCDILCIDGRYMLPADDIKLIRMGINGDLLYLGSDNYVHLYDAASDTTVTLGNTIAPTDNVYGSFTGPYVSVRVNDAQWRLKSDQVYTHDGTAVDFGDGYELSSELGNKILVRKQTNTVGTATFAYRVYDQAGAIVGSFDAGGNYIRELDDDGSYYLTSSDDDSPIQMEIWRSSNGSLVRRLTSTEDYAFLLTMHGGEPSSVVGYRLTEERRDDETGGYHVVRYSYYDTNFNLIDVSPVSDTADPWINIVNHELPGVGLVRTIAACKRAYSDEWVKVAVTDASGSPVSIGGYTLGVYVDETSNHAANSVKHGNADLWWATDGNGKWGAVDSTGAVKVPFAYDGYYDLGTTDTDYVLVKQDGVWDFLDLKHPTKISIKDAMVTVPSGPFAYTGSAFTPEPTVSLAGTTLTPVRDFSVTYENNVDPGRATVVITGTGAYAGTTSAVFDISSPSAVSMLRLYNPNSGEHFYTASVTERDRLVSVGWHDEGIGWRAPGESTKPVYRLYNPNAGDHHYTTDAGERDMLSDAGWNDEGIGWYSAGTGSIPLLRLYNPNAKAGAHHFTTSTKENDYLASVGWREEGVGWWGL